MVDNGQMAVRVWGVRGSVPTPRADSVRYGGNTTCLQVFLPDFPEPLIIDAGTGIRELARALRPAANGVIHLLLSHFHWDHLQGLPFFSPLYDDAATLRIHAGLASAETEQLLRGQMAPPYFPVPFDFAPSRREYRRFPDGALHIGPASITTIPLNHPQGALGFRVQAGGRVLVHVCDHEHGIPEIDAGILRAARNADLLIYDAQFTPEEYESRRGWGHSTWKEGVRIAQEAGVRRLVLTHHDPAHDDDFLDAMTERAREVFPAVEAASEARVITL